MSGRARRFFRYLKNAIDSGYFQSSPLLAFQGADDGEDDHQRASHQQRESD